MKPELTFFAILSLVGFVLVYMDKQKAIRHQWRIPERVFYMMGFLGGSVGIWIGMFQFHHKTRKNPFRWILFGTLVINVLILIYLNQ
jgi:uncharacterized membrane protein YsdA (DUF1294 family)